MWQQANIKADTRKIPGAKVISPQEIKDKLAELPKSEMIVAYCACPNDGTRSAVAKLLIENGYNAAALTKGYDSWVAAKYPIERISP